MLTHIDELEARNIDCYIQYTLNDYEAEGLEKGVPPLAFRIDTFKKLVDRLGKGRVIWRFDPMILTDAISIDSLLKKIERIGNQMVGYTEKLVFSFADILSYRKVKANLNKSHISYQDWTEPQMLEFAERLAALNEKWGYTLATCGEKIDLKQLGIVKNRCVDDELIIRLSFEDKALMDFLKVTIHPMPAADLFGNAAPLPPMPSSFPTAPTPHTVTTETKASASSADASRARILENITLARIFANIAMRIQAKRRQ